MCNLVLFSAPANGTKIDYLVADEKIEYKIDKFVPSWKDPTYSFDDLKTLCGNMTHVLFAFPEPIPPDITPKTLTDDLVYDSFDDTIFQFESLE